MKIWWEKWLLKLAIFGVPWPCLSRRSSYLFLFNYIHSLKFLYWIFLGGGKSSFSIQKCFTLAFEKRFYIRLRQACAIGQGYEFVSGQTNRPTGQKSNRPTDPTIDLIIHVHATLKMASSLSAISFLLLSSLSLVAHLICKFSPWKLVLGSFAMFSPPGTPGSSTALSNHNFWPFQNWLAE